MQEGVSKSDRASRPFTYGSGAGQAGRKVLPVVPTHARVVRRCSSRCLPARGHPRTRGGVRKNRNGRQVLGRPANAGVGPYTTFTLNMDAWPSLQALGWSILTRGEPDPNANVQRRARSLQEHLAPLNSALL